MTEKNIESDKSEQVMLSKQINKRVRQNSSTENVSKKQKREDALERDRLYHAHVRSIETPEQRKIRLERDRLRKSQARSVETPEQRAIRLERARLYKSRIRSVETPEQRKIRLESARLRDLHVRSTETPEQREIRLERARLHKSQVKAIETPEQREIRLESARLRDSQLRSAETPEQRAIRLECARLRNSQVRSVETSEQREIRLERDRLRHLENRHPNINQQYDIFENTINTFCDRVCEVCTKLCYPNQVVSFKPGIMATSYLPDELKGKSTLLLCHRCKTHLSSKKKDAPSKAYWNSLDPGLQPDVLKNLTQPEVRLLSRIIPFVKIVKYGRFGQYGFRGQAVLFAQDIFEVTEKLPIMLPRSSNCTGMVVITERLENLNVVREFSISRTKVYDALRWLIVNNPLYKDVTIDNEAQIDEQDVIRFVEPVQQQPITVQGCQESSYKKINEVSRILRASWNQGDEGVFSSESVGVQCCAMALANIVKALEETPQTWSKTRLDNNMLEGDRVYKEIKTLTAQDANAVHIPDDGFLDVRNFNIVKRDLIMFGKHFSLEYDADTNLVGNLQDKMNKNKEISKTLNESLIELFSQHAAGILIIAGKSFGVMNYDNKFYFTDSYSCGPKGASARSNSGKACVIECDTFAEFQRVCRRAVGSKNQQYTLNYIDVSKKNSSPVAPDITQADDINNAESSQNNQQDANEQLNRANDAVENQINHTAYIRINDVSRIVRAEWHQGNEKVFTSGYAGIQCFAMVLANILRAYVYPPDRWTTKTLNKNMLEGDRIYSIIRFLTEDNPNAHRIPDDGYLQVQNLAVVKNDITMYDWNFFIDYEEDTLLFGSLQDDMNQDFGFTLYNALNLLFEQHQAGVLIAAFQSLGVMQYNEKYYFTDSHSCNSRGESTALNGRACVIECDTLEELERVCKRAVGNNGQFTLNHIQVNTRHDPVLEELRENEEIDKELENIEIPSDEVQNVPVQNENNQIPSHEEQNIPVQTFVMAPNDHRQPDVEEEFVVSDRVNDIIRKTKDNIVNVEHELKAEEFGWYQMFPYGMNGLKEPTRRIKITPLDYFQYRITGKDTRFQRNDYLFYALSMFEYNRVKSVISACGKKVENDGGRVEDLHLCLKNLRGSAAYWRTAMNELLAQIRCLGAPHYFLTFSCNDLHWLDMKKALLIADGRPDVNPNDLDFEETQRLVEKYPVIVSRHFNNRVKALMKFLKDNDMNIFGGKLVDYWWRVEFQNRGSPHLHMVIWLEDYPSFDTEEGLRLIDQVCSCELPSEDSELYELVKQCQTHHHTETCRKNNTVCRFGFPRQECSETRIVAHSSDDFIRSGGRICLLKRRQEDKWINNYNPILLKLWKGNMDIQPCGSNEAIAYYIGKYLSKSEPTELSPGIAQAIRQIQREENDTSRKLFKICMRILQERQVSACECVYRLCHLNLRESSRKCIFLNTRKPEQRYRVIKFDASGRANGYYDNIFERYEKRPLQHQEYDFDNMSLLEFAMLFEPYYKKKPNEAEEDFDQYVTQRENVRNRYITLSDNSRMLIRSKPAVVRVPYFKASDDQENFYYSMLLQYMPYRNEGELIGEYNDAKAAFMAREEQIKQINEHMQLFRRRDQQLENAFNQVHAFEILNQNPNLVDEDDNEEEMPDRPLDDNQFQQAQRAMNAGQREVFRLVTESVQQQMNGSAARLRLFITGNAGTGKSFILHLLKNQVNRCFAGEKVTKVCALTGVAARLIGGSTLHSTLKLPVQKDGRIVQMPLLTGMYLRQMRLQWRNIKFIFIDEISMVPYEMLYMIDSRLKQLMNCDDFFGGLNIILFGDLMQLPPVRGNQVFCQPEHLAPATHLWRLFSLIELTENMRQQGSTTFIDILNALRIGELKTEHISELMKRVDDSEDGDFSIEKALRIYPTNDQVFRHNQRVVNHFKSKQVQMYLLRAQDQLVDSTRNSNNINLEDIIPKDVNKTGGLPSELEIFAGAKIMLRSNIDVQKGLVNGAIGFITEIIWPLYRRGQMYDTDLPAVRVDFGNEGIHVIQPRSVQFPAKYSYGTVERRMLPMVLSWASTVHKMQGSTVDFAVVYLGPRIFAEGQAYVALSRVRSLEGLRIESLDSTKITGKKPCNNAALAEMERMRNIT